MLGSGHASSWPHCFDVDFDCSEHKVPSVGACASPINEWTVAKILRCLKETRVARPRHPEVSNERQPLQERRSGHDPTRHGYRNLVPFLANSAHNFAAAQ